MDPLSITTGVITLATLAKQVTNVLAGIRQDWDSLPGRIHALNNEIQDFSVVLHQIVIAVEERKVSCWNDNDESTLPRLLTRGETALVDLKGILESLLSTGVRKREAIPRVRLWRREQGRIAALQNDVKQVKSSMNLLLGASNSREMMHVRLQLEELSLKVSDYVEATTPGSELPTDFIKALLEQHHAAVSESVSQKYSHVDERLDRVEALLLSQSSQMHASQVSQVGPLYNASTPPTRRRPVRPVSPASASRIQENSAAVRVRLRQMRASCHATCHCSCHSVQDKKSPSFMDRMLGQLFIGYSGLPFLSSKCDSSACVRGQIPTVNAEYWFPLGFCWSQIVRLHLTYEANTGPSFQLSTLRRVSDSAHQGVASPRDVSSTRGYSLLRWALYGQQYETCKFLMTAGADPTYRPVARSDDCPSDKAVDIVLRGRIPPAVIDILRVISEGSDYIERQNFAPIHEIVLGLREGDLEDEIRQSPKDVDYPDATGRTALQWAAARGDERAVVTLLSWGADPNNMDNKLNAPLTLASNQNQTVCVRLLLEAGALTDPELPPGVKFGTPLNCAARNAPDPMLTKTLLDFNANIEASGVDGVTPLLHVARGNSAAHAMLLLEYGANINGTSKSGQTPLTAAIQCNNHAVLKLLLERWSEYNECPRLKGPNLLEVVAKYADIETMILLTAVEHLRVRKDSAYIMNHYRQIIDTRDDASEKLGAAFEDLMSILRTDTAGCGGRDVESGLLSPLDCPGSSSDDTDSDAFEDAREGFDGVSL